MVKRGELWWVDLGSEPDSGYRRPVVVISSNRFNRSRLPTVIVAAVTSNLRLAHSPGNVILDPADTGLDCPSVIDVTQVLTVDRAVFESRIGRLPGERAQALDVGLRMALRL